MLDNLWDIEINDINLRMLVVYNIKTLALLAK